MPWLAPVEIGRGGIVPAAIGAVLVTTFTVKVCVALRPPGSVAVTVISDAPVGPTDVMVSWFPEVLAVTTAGMEDSAA